MINPTTIAARRALLLAVLALLLALYALLAGMSYRARAQALDDGYTDGEWIARQGRRNAAGEYCCGRADCYVVPAEFVRITAAGYRLMPAGAENETVPYREAQVSPDGRYWRCRRPDGTRRCFFAPPPGA